MPAPGNPRRGGSAPRSRSGSNLRLSDADRAEVAERLSKHYADGRLDEAEFTERVDLAMSAKTESDLTGLFSDLPDTRRPEPPIRRRHHYRGIIFLVVVVLLAAAIGQALVRSFVPWLLVGLFVFLWLRYHPRHHRHL
jgi:Domain of unknown function (DUF1707)